MNTLPSSIETYLLDAGFSGTEVLILKHLLENEPLSVRQLAAKTGKTVGVLDQALKKLHQKNIITRQWINETFTFSIHSLGAVSKWMEKEMHEKKAALQRKHQNFETFLHTLELDKHHPDIEYFDGEEGMKKAYTALLSAGKEMLQFTPILCAIEDDPLRDFKVQYFRERRARGMYARVITQNTVLGRRFESRDPFEYRKTLLVPEEMYPFTFEKIIVGDTVACFNMSEKRACLLRYPELAAMERAIFEGMWKKESQPAAQASVAPEARTMAEVQTRVPLKTELLSRVREFFLSRWSLAVFFLFALGASVLTFALQLFTSHLNFQLLREKAQAIAVNASYTLDPQDLLQLQQEQDWQKPEWRKVVETLKSIRLRNPGVTFVYLFRRDPQDPQKLVFVADSHSLNPYANTDEDSLNDVDANGDGVVDPEGSDLLQWPGQSYPVPPGFNFAVFQHPLSTENFLKDGWGIYMTGYSPIKNTDGNTAAVLAVDFAPDKLAELNSRVLNPLIIFLGIFLLFVVLRLAAFNRSLLADIWKVARLRRTLYIGGLVLECIILLWFAAYFYSLHTAKREIGEKLMLIAINAVPQFDPADLEQLRFARDMKTEAYQRVFKKLNEIRATYPEIKYAYIQRMIEYPNLLQFVADADSNYSLPRQTDFNLDGQLNPVTEANVAPGVFYWDCGNDYHIAIRQPSYTKRPCATQWGYLISGYAPILDKEGRLIAIIGLDTESRKITAEILEKFYLSLNLIPF